MLADSFPVLKRRRFAIADSMDAQISTEKLDAAKKLYGREIRVFETTSAMISQTSNDASGSEEQDELEFTPEDYYRILSTKKEDKYLKTKKIRDAETAARRSRMTKAVIRVRFPDNHTLEATFHPSETMQSLFDLIVKVVARPDLPFYIYTVPPKKLINDMSQDFYSAGFAPGAIVYFSYDPPQGDDIAQVPFLKEEVMFLKGVEVTPVQKPEPIDQPAPEPVAAAAPPARKPATDKKMVKPKWLKM
ncbi:plant UBX domain-containing protein 1-like [Rutidosis leptorrhynchoides]|uniref:plant UBX domain-containing protein 1-like n=1 Tax=Rutidosis leptorrhynchoides TaxID=125765 RepID=UPI003A9A1B8B